MSNSASFREHAVQYYTGSFRTHGPCAKGMDWPNEESQILRFRQLLRIVPPEGEDFTLLDYGCGYGALLPVLAGSFPRFRYVGYDPAPEILACARERNAADPRCRFVSDLREAGAADYAVASGIWNVRQNAGFEEWTEYVLAELAAMNAVAARGIAFNILTSYADEEKKRPDLYYADPLFLFDHCMRNFSRKTALLHDYPLYEFTMLVRK